MIIMFNLNKTYVVCQIVLTSVTAETYSLDFLINDSIMHSFSNYNVSDIKKTGLVG